MDDIKQTLQGSAAHDVFKRRHKQALPSKCYALDIDLVLISKHPPGVVAYLDFKRTSDSLTFTEVMFYNFAMLTAPVYIVEGDDPENGPFEVYRYLGGDWRPDPPTAIIEHDTSAQEWRDLSNWELSIREEYKRRAGWNGQLKKPQRVKTSLKRRIT